MATYVGLPLFFLIWFGYRWAKGTRIVPLAEMRVHPEPH